jgi:hypothetical protein
MTHERYTYFGMARATFTGPTGAGPQRQSIRRFERVVMAGRGYVVKGKNCLCFTRGIKGGDTEFIFTAGTTFSHPELKAESLHYGITKSENDSVTVVKNG